MTDRADWGFTAAMILVVCFFGLLTYHFSIEDMAKEELCNSAGGWYHSGLCIEKRCSDRGEQMMIGLAVLVAGALVAACKLEA